MALKSDKIGDRVAWFTVRHTSGGVQAELQVGTIEGWRDGKVAVRHQIPRIELVAADDLYLLQEPPHKSLR